MEPKFTKNGGKIEKNTMEGPKWPLGGSQSLQKVKDDHPLGCFWLPWGSPKSTKNRSLAPKGAPGSVFLSIFLAGSVFLTFGLDFSSIFGEILMKISMHFLHTSSILSVSLFEIAKLALAKRYAHCCFVNSDACRLGGVEKI